MELARIMARGQTTIPKGVREAANLCEGDMLSFEIEGDRLVVRKVAPGRDDYLHSLSEVLGEWVSPRTRKRGVTL